LFTTETADAAKASRKGSGDEVALKAATGAAAVALMADEEALKENVRI